MGGVKLKNGGLVITSYWLAGRKAARATVVLMAGAVGDLWRKQGYNVSVSIGLYATIWGRWGLDIAERSNTTT